MGEEGLTREAGRALAELERLGLLLMTDAKLPSLVALVAAGPVRGSWWGHPKGRAIYEAATLLEDHPDATLVQLVSGKATFVHRRLWPALLAVAGARDAWQMNGLPAASRRLLQRVDEQGRVRAGGMRGGREGARVLEQRLLVHAHGVHTESGAHAKELVSWRSWSAARRVRPLRDAAAGRRRIEEALHALMAAGGGRGRLPWQ